MSVRALALLALWAPAGCAAVGSGGEAPRGATVYRDENGVPHVVGDTEQEVWYALGHENARDALFVVQKNLKLWSGHAAEFLGGERAVPALHDPWFRSDWIAAVFRTDLERRYAGRDLERALVEMLGSEALFHDLEAYARGLDDYRRRIESAADLTDRERRLRDWLDAQDAAWVYTEPIGVADVAAWGPYITSFAAFLLPQLDDPTPSAQPPRPPASASVHPSWELDASAPIEVVKAALAGLPGAGSNALAWSSALTDPADRHTGHLADPQGGFHAAFATPGGGRPDDLLVDPKFFAHAVVRGEGGLDVFGYLVSGSGTFFSFHNRDFALGGSASNANTADSFLLRLRTEGADPSGPPLLDPETGTWSYYSFYADVDGDDGADEEDWVPLPVVRVAIRDAAGVERELRHLDAGPFGVVPFPEPFPVPNRRAWIPGGPNEVGTLGTEHVRASGDDPGTIPCLVAYRVPGLPGVDHRGWTPGTPPAERPTQPHNDRFATGEYRLLRATSAHDLQAELVRLDASYAVNSCAADRDGRLFVGRAAAVPARGDDQALAALHARGLVPAPLEPAAKQLVYEKLNGKKEPVPARWAADRAYDWCFDGDRLVYLVPEGPGGEGEVRYAPYLLHDPVSGDHHPPGIAGYATASNDEVRFAGRAAAGEGGPADAGLLDRVWRAGTLYASAFQSGGPLPKTAAFLDALAEIERGERAPLDGAAAADLALSARLFVQRDYPGYETADGWVLVPGVERLPTPVRALAELAAVLEVVAEAAEREGRFLAELGRRLADDEGLRRRVGDVPVPPAPLSAAERAAFAALVDELVAWEAEGFENAVDSRPALLVEELRLGLAPPLAGWLFGADRHATLLAEVGAQPVVRLPVPPHDALPEAGEPDVARLAAFGRALRAIPSGLPPTRGLLRAHVVRRLVAAARFVDAELGPEAGFGDLVRARAFALDGSPVGPPEGLACTGPGLRVVARDPEEPGGGFRTRLWALGGSDDPVLTLFPSGRPDEPPRSFFWSLPAPRPADFGDSHALRMLAAYAANRPLPTHFADYEDSRTWSTDPGLPPTPYRVAPPR